MDRLLARLRRFLAELGRRNVYKVGATYLVVVFFTLRGAQLIFPATTLAGLYDTLVVLAFVGFPIALVLAWALELTPEGNMQRTAPARDGPAEEAPARASAPSNRWIGVSMAALVLLGAWWLLYGPSEGPEPAEAPVSTEAPERSVAVLPFEALGAEKPGPFVEGIHDDLLTRLSNVGDLQVISRTSVQRYRDTELSLPAIAESLGVRWVVEGGVQRAEGRVRINAQLIDPRSDAHRWAESYERDLSAENLFAIQGDIAGEIARSLEAELTAGEQERIVGAPTEDLEAHRLYVQGRQRLARFAFTRPQTLAEAVPYFRSAIERDSSYALAWAGLADAAAYVDYYENYFDWPDTVRTPAVDKEEAARRALELSPNLAEAHASMGFIRLADGDAPEAAGQLRRAIDLKPSYWEGHQWLGFLYLVIGRAQEAVDHLELTLELNPEHALARHWLYDAYLAAGEAEKSLEEAQRQQRLGLEGVGAVGGEVRALYHLGRLEEARRITQEQIADLGPEARWGGPEATWGAWLRAYLVGIHAAAGDTAQARRHLSQLRNAKLPSPAILAWAYAGLGEAGRALETYQRLTEEEWRRIGPSVQLRYGVGTDLELLRADPRYEELLREADRAWNLNPDGSLPGSEGLSAGF